MAGEWGVVDYDGNLMPERWETEKDALKFGVCGKYLLSGSHVIRVPDPDAPTEPVIAPYVPGESDATAPLRKKTRRLPKQTEKEPKKPRRGRHKRRKRKR